MIWDYETSSCVKSFELSELPVRCAKFIARKQWFIAASDDMRLRVYNYNTMEKVKEFEAHQDYIRAVEIHPTLPYILSCSDDMSIKLWDWEQGFDCTQYFEGHAHYVMQVKFNPKDTNTFASGSLDRSIKVWGLGSPTPHYTLEGHERGVNCIDYYPSGDKPYILSGADDQTVKIWDYQVRLSIHNQKLYHHERNHVNHYFYIIHLNTIVSVVITSIFVIISASLSVQTLTTDKIYRALSRWTLSQRLRSSLSPQTAPHCLRFRRWNSPSMAKHHISCRNYPQLRNGTCLDTSRNQRI